MNHTEVSLLETAVKRQKKREFGNLKCDLEYRDPDWKTQVQYRECRTDYTHCPNQNCIKKLL